jgi:hypothetical protein
MMIIFASFTSWPTPGGQLHCMNDKNRLAEVDDVYDADHPIALTLNHPFYVANIPWPGTAGMYHNGLDLTDGKAVSCCMLKIPVIPPKLALRYWII